MQQRYPSESISPITKRPENCHMFGLNFLRATTAETVEYLMQLTAENRRAGHSSYVATVNVDFLVNALGWKPNSATDPELLTALREADVITADGMPLVWLSRLLGQKLPGRVAGADLVPTLATHAAKGGQRLFFLGGRDDTAELAAHRLRLQNPNLQIVDVMSPTLTLEPDAVHNMEAVARVQDAAPDILLLALGNPKQELWYRQHRHELNVPLVIGVGGTFAFLAGVVSRAPRWMQVSGLEWIYRIMQEPRRLWRRYARGLVKFTWLASNERRYTSAS